jgi:steroid 5-alpha reductase family enzyme
MSSFSDLNTPFRNIHDNPPPHYAFHGHHVGLLQETLFESFTLHSALAILGYGAGRYTDRVEAKDYLWPSSLLINGWWSAVGRRVIVEGISAHEALFSLTWADKLLLTGVTAWGSRLLYRIATRSIERGTDDPRYEEAKKEEGFWNKSAYKLFLPEVLFQTVISLPFTLPFRDSHTSPSLHTIPEIEALGVGVFAAGFILELVADAQLAEHKKKGGSDLNREGVWSIVRHPKYVPYPITFQPYHISLSQP